MAESQRPAPNRRSAFQHLTITEVQEAFAAYRDRYPPILVLSEAAEIARLKPSTLKRLVSEGRFKGSVRRGKPLRFWRDRFVQNTFEPNG